MLIQSLVHEDHQLDEALDELQPEEATTRISHLLDRLRSSISADSDHRVYRRVVNLFRKWKLILASDYAQPYPHDIEWQDVQRTRVDTPLMSGGSLQIVVQGRTQEIVERIDKEINPFSRDAIASLLGAEISVHYPGLVACMDAEREFRASELERAERLARKVVQETQNPRPDGLEAYGVAWALHVLGNIDLLRRNFRPAEAAYQKALEIKRGIPSLGRLNTLTTESKVLFARLSGGTDRTRTLQGLQEIWKCLSSSATTFKHTNELLYDNLRGDLMNRIAMAQVFMGRHKSGRRSAQTSLEIATKISDRIGMLRAIVVLGMGGGSSDELLRRLDATLNEFEETDVGHPYARWLRDDGSRYAVSRFESDFARLLDDALDRRGVQPPPMSEAVSRTA